MSLEKKDNFSNDSFCPEVYNQIQIDMQGDIRACCLMSDSGMIEDDQGVPMNIKTHSILDAINSKSHKQHRLELSNNIRPSRCSNCYTQENHSPNSRRIKFINYSKNGTLPDYVKAEDAYSITASDGSIDTDVTPLLNLDMRFGNLCNLKCIMCDPGNSSLWYNDWDLLSRSFAGRDENGRLSKFLQGGVDPVTGESQYWKSKNKVYLLQKNKHDKLKLEGEQNWWETDSWKQQFEAIAPRLQHIYFTGGEPLIVPAMTEHLDYLIEQGFSKNIRLLYDTNLTVINQNILDRWKFFKKIELRISVDEVGDRYNLVRNPGNFDKLEENIQLIQDAGIHIHRITMVCGFANLYGTIRVAQFAKKINKELSLRFVNRPGWLNIQNLPVSAKKELIQVLTDFLNSDQKHTIAGYEYVIKSQIEHLNNTLDAPTQKYAVETFVRTMNILDKPRNLDWKTILPDVVDLLQRHCPGLDLDMAAES